MISCVEWVCGNSERETETGGKPIRTVALTFLIGARGFPGHLSELLIGAEPFNSRPITVKHSPQASMCLNNA